jgi:hypothetical protein
MGLIGFDMGFFVWLVGIVAAIIVAIGVIVLNVQKWVIVLATSLWGAGIIIGTFLFMFGGLPSADVAANPVRQAIADSPFWLITFLILAVVAFVAQVMSTRSWVIEDYNRWDEYYGPTTPTSPTM